jgi:DNA polymerase III delta prime subunit
LVEFGTIWYQEKNNSPVGLHSFTNMKTSIILQHHAHLWIANPQTLDQQIVAELQQILCPMHGCQNCSICILIEKKQHPWTYWLQPIGSYTLDQIDEILQNVRFKLDSTEQRFIVFEQSEELTANCNNRLLKTIEEPHSGYFFIFLATRTDNILPTLQSRCFLKEFDQQSSNFEYEEFIQPFLKNRFDRPLEFIKLIDTLEIKERETKDIIDFMIASFHAQLKNIDLNSEQHQEKMLKITDKILILKQALSKLPPQGSAKMFWKNLYLQFDCDR